MLPIKSWRIYYADGSTFDSTMGAWGDAPPFGVQAVVYYHADTRRTVQVEGNDHSRYEYLGDGALTGHKLGLWMDSEGFYRILELAKGSSSP